MGVTWPCHQRLCTGLVWLRILLKWLCFYVFLLLLLLLECVVSCLLLAVLCLCTYFLKIGQKYDLRQAGIRHKSCSALASPYVMCTEIFDRPWCYLVLCGKALALDKVKVLLHCRCFPRGGNWWYPAGRWCFPSPFRRWKIKATSIA